jgi:tRNA (cytidine/uridine-2'-O-)-methyltransferase
MPFRFCRPVAAKQRQAILLKNPNYATDCRRNRQPPRSRRTHYNDLASSGKTLNLSIDLRLALFEPDIPQNTGALFRLAACFGVAVDLIEPVGFLLDDRRVKRVALDYLGNLAVRRHESWATFLAGRDPASRLVLMTTAGDQQLHRFAFAAGDTILLGRESAGVPEAVHRAAAARVVIPMRPPARSLNVALAGAIALYEALRQTGQVPMP